MPSVSKTTTNARRMNTLRLDPTRTTMLRKRFVADMKRRFNAFRKALNDLVVKEDAFGLARKGIMVVHQRYAALMTPQQLEEFRRWVEEQTGRIISGNENWLKGYIEEAYEKGQGRSYDDVMKKYGYGGRASPEYYQGSREQFLRDAFRQPASVERVQLLASRAYTDLKGITPQMSTQLNRTMTDAIIQGKSPREVGRELNKVVSGYRNRGVTIARTETIRAHADGQLDSLKNLGVEELGVMVEWSAASDDLVCELCSELDGAVFKINEASGIIPRHPNCRCAWLPANVGEDTKRRAWTKKDESGKPVWKDVVQKKGNRAQLEREARLAELPVGRRSPPVDCGELAVNWLMLHNRKGPCRALEIRSARAKSTHKPSSVDKQRHAELNEVKLAKKIKGTALEDDEPMDVIIKVGNKEYGIELKTMLDNGNDKITMHPASRLRKEVWAKKRGRSVHTVIIDDRAVFRGGEFASQYSGNRLYYRRGVGAFRLNSMIPVSSEFELSKMIKMTNRQLETYLKKRPST